jgi:hypothetical protein
MTKKEKAQREEARKYLRSCLKPGDTIYLIRRNQPGNGLTRSFDLFYIGGGEPCRITVSACEAAGYTYGRKQEAMRTTNDPCGVVHSLAVALFCPTEYDHDKAFCLNYREL